MKLDFSDKKIDDAIRKNSKRSSMVLDLANSTSWISDEKLFLARETKSKIEISRIKMPFTGILPSVIIVFKKSDLQNPKVRLSIFGYILLSVLLSLFLFGLFKKLTDFTFEGDLVFAAILLTFFLCLVGIEYYLTRNSFNKLKQRIIE